MSTVRMAPIELDVATAPAFVAEIRKTIDRADAGPLRIDCEHISFMDSAAFYAIRDLTRYASTAGHPLLIGNVMAMPAWLLAFCDWDHELTIQPLVPCAADAPCR